MRVLAARPCWHSLQGPALRRLRKMLPQQQQSMNTCQRAPRHSALRPPPAQRVPLEGAACLDEHRVQHDLVAAGAQHALHTPDEARLCAMKLIFNV